MRGRSLPEEGTQSAEGRVFGKTAGAGRGMIVVLSESKPCNGVVSPVAGVGLEAGVLFPAVVQLLAGLLVLLPMSTKCSCVCRSTNT